VIFDGVSILRILRMLSGASGLISPSLHDGKPDDAVFKVVATVPVAGLPLVAQNRGIITEVFASQQEALKWLDKWLS
jgi:hypothetical protein